MTDNIEYVAVEDTPLITHQSQLDDLLSTQGNAKQRARHWGPNTWNNPIDTIPEFCRRLQAMLDGGVIIYACFQEEKAPTTGTPHYQFYVHMSKQLRLKSVRKLFPGCHMEMSKYPAAARNYCYDKTKESFVAGPYEFGVWVPPTKKRDCWKHIVELFKEGKTIEDILMYYPALYAQYKKGIQTIYSDLQPDRNEPTEFIFICGPTDAGKTRYVFDRETKVFSKSHTGNWFDGYKHEPAVLLDDFNGQIQYEELLKILDRYPYQVAVKGGFVKFNAKRVYITANDWPHKWYQRNDFSALLRRMTEYHEYTEEGLCFKVIGKQEIKKHFGGCNRVYLNKSQK